jgi:hypothetical protein
MKMEEATSHDFLSISKSIPNNLWNLSTELLVKMEDFTSETWWHNGRISDVMANLHEASSVTKRGHKVLNFEASEPLELLKDKFVAMLN